jgi:CBS domain containing-hemolysin-like protein
MVAMSAYFSITETAFTSFNRIRMKNILADGNKRAKLVLNLSENYDKLISTILIGNTIVNIVAASVATLVFVALFGAKAGAPLSAVVLTIVVLIFAEISPKSIAKEMPEKFCLFSAPIINILIFICTPLNFIFAAWKRFLTKIFTIDSGGNITGEELITIVEEAKTEGGINTEQSELIQNAIEFNEVEAWDVLTPRVDVKAIEIDTPKDEVSKLFIETGFSRLPVYDETIDKIIGVLNQKDFSNYIINSDKEISEYVKPVVFKPGSVKIPALLKQMQKIKTHIAVIVDEYGGTEGIVTMEDIIEELVGEIYDEHDEVTTQEFVQQQDGSFRVLCGANVEKMFDYFEIEEEEMDVTTVNGWVVVALDKLPEAGDSFDYKNLSVTVTKADGKKALEISVIKKEDLNDREREQ